MYAIAADARLAADTNQDHWLVPRRQAAFAFAMSFLLMTMREGKAVETGTLEDLRHLRRSHVRAEVTGEELEVEQEGVAVGHRDDRIDRQLVGNAGVPDRPRRGRMLRQRHLAGHQGPGHAPLAPRRNGAPTAARVLRKPTDDSSRTSDSPTPRRQIAPPTKVPRSSYRTPAFRQGEEDENGMHVFRDERGDCDADSELIFGQDTEAKYEKAMKKIGVQVGMLSSEAGHA